MVKGTEAALLMITGKEIPETENSLALVPDIVHPETVSLLFCGLPPE